jgi:predicted DNA-binding protein (MmcQ/YjbR family)
MAKADAILKKVDEICLSFPDTKVSRGWGDPHYTVKGKIFAGASNKTGPRLQVRLELEHADMLIDTDPRFVKTKYGADSVDIDLSGKVDWKQIRALVEESYNLTVAAKRSRARSRARRG